jgi:hypothetical protein
MPAIMAKLFGALPAIWKFVKRPLAERNTGQRPGVPQLPPLEKSVGTTIARLGGNVLHQSAIEKTVNDVIGKAVQPEWAKAQSVSEWLSVPKVQQFFAVLLSNRLSGQADEAEAIQHLTSSYMDATGENAIYAESAISAIQNVLTAAVYAEVTDVGTFVRIEALSRLIDAHQKVLLAKIAALDDPTSALTYDRLCTRNQTWLRSVLGDQTKARTYFRQPLSPRDPRSSTSYLVRADLTRRLISFMQKTGTPTVCAVLGEEGNGKSWLVADAWGSLPAPPLTLFITAERLASATEQAVLQRVLGTILHEQTGAVFDTALLQRWWENKRYVSDKPHEQVPQVLLIVDGLNQKPTADWAGILALLDEVLKPFSGRIVVTARPEFFARYVQGRLVFAHEELSVSPWTADERDAILRAAGVDPMRVHPRTALSLLNPRLLSIAINLLDGSQIETIEALNVERLLFEYVRRFEQEGPDLLPVGAFAQRLQDHASQLLERVRQQQDDITLFRGGLESVAEGRFFSPVAGEPQLYSLNSEGASLALGFAIVADLRKAKRNHHALRDTVERMITPIQALDLTSAALLAALTIAALDPTITDDIAGALLKAFAGVQNPDEHEFPAFVSVVGRRITTLVAVVEECCLAEPQPSNFDWLEAAIKQLHDTATSGGAIGAGIGRWLTFISLAPERRVLAAGNDGAGLQAEVARCRSELQCRIDGLTEPERQLLTDLVRVDRDTFRLSTLCFRLLAGHRLEPFSDALVRWAFADRLNGPLFSPTDEFAYLLRFNTRDWTASRTALRSVLYRLLSDTSTVGARTQQLVLGATGNPDDATAAQLIQRQIDPEARSYSWNHVSDFSTSDPCDPTSEESLNLTTTADRFDTLDVSKLHQYMGHSPHEHFFYGARTAVARFRPQVAVNTHRRFLEELTRRSGLALRQAVFAASEHGALVTRQLALELVGMVRSGAATAALAALPDTEQWVIVQYLLWLSFPQLSAEEQVDALLAGDGARNFLLDLLDVVEPLAVERMAELLNKAYTDADGQRQFVLLALAQLDSSYHTEAIEAVAGFLVRSPDAAVRTQALAFLAQSSREAALRSAVDTWGSLHAPGEGRLEQWAAGRLLIAASKCGAVTVHEAALHISAEFAPALLSALPSDSAALIGVLEPLFQRLLAQSVNPPAVAIELENDNHGLDRPTSVHLEPLASQADNTIEGRLRALSADSSGDFAKRQEELHAAFERFSKTLEQQQMAAIINDMPLDCLVHIETQCPGWCEQWAGRFADCMLQRPARIPQLFNFGVALAFALAARKPALSARLFRLLRGRGAVASIRFGSTRLDFLEAALWRAEPSDPLREVWQERLASVENDAELAEEVLAALLAGRSTQVESIALALLKAPEPRQVAAGLLIIGFGDFGERADEVFARFDAACGFVGEALKAARGAHDRNVWAKRWHGLMAAAESAEELWRYQVLLTKIVDGRFELWGVPEYPTSVYRRCWPLIQRPLRRRCEKWHDKRKERFLGSKVPPACYIQFTEAEPFGVAAN